MKLFFTCNFVIDMNKANEDHHFLISRGEIQCFQCNRVSAHSLYLCKLLSNQPSWKHQYVGGIKLGGVRRGNPGDSFIWRDIQYNETLTLINQTENASKAYERDIQSGQPPLKTKSVEYWLYLSVMVICFVQGLNICNGMHFKAHFHSWLVNV